MDVDWVRSKAGNARRRALHELPRCMTMRISWWSTRHRRDAMHQVGRDAIEFAQSAPVHREPAVHKRFARADTVLRDDPQRTLRLCNGPESVCVEIDPNRRLDVDRRFINDAAAPRFVLVDADTPAMGWHSQIARRTACGEVPTRSCVRTSALSCQRQGRKHGSPARQGWRACSLRCNRSTCRHELTQVKN